MTTLADKIVQSAGGLMDTRAMYGGLSEMANDIKTSEIFNFDVSAAGACYQLSSSKPSSLLEATKFCRVPFERIWVEWSPGLNSTRGFVEPHWSDEHKASGMIPPKMGCLIKCLDDSHKRFGCAFVWDTPADRLMQMRNADPTNLALETGLNICPIGFIVNWHDGWMPGSLAVATEELRSRLRKEVRLEGGYQKFRDNEKEMQSIRDLLANRMPCQVPYAKRMMEHIGKTSGYLALERLWKSSEYDVEGEYHLVIAMLCLLNSRNCISLEKPDLTKINKARKKRGKEPFLVHSTVNINLSKTDSRRAEHLGVSAADIRQHIVRGHFKVRRGGVFWWRPFLRGDIEVGRVIRDGYKVTNTLPAQGEKHEAA